MIENLESISIRSGEWELEPEEVSDLNEYLPNLKSLTLNYQTQIIFEKWIKNYGFHNVEYSYICLVDEHVEDRSYNYVLSLDTELVKGMHKSFPNIRDLYLVLNACDMSSLDGLFENRKTTG